MLFPKEAAAAAILALAILPTYSYGDGQHAPQITTPPSTSEYTSALARDALYRRAKHDSTTSLGSADALYYCQGNVRGCAHQLVLYNDCSSKYHGDYKYLYCLCTTGYYDDVSQCDACSASLGATPWEDVSSTMHYASSRCAALSSTYGNGGGNTKTHSGGGGDTATKSGGNSHKSTKTTGAAATEATSTLAPATSTSTAVSLPTEPYAGLAGPPTIPGENGVAAPTNSKGAAVGQGLYQKSAGLLAGVLVCLGGAVLL